MSCFDKDFNEMYDYLVEYNYATDKEINLVCCINGSSLDTLNDILYAKTGYRSLEQIQEMED